MSSSWKAFATILLQTATIVLLIITAHVNVAAFQSPRMTRRRASPGVLTRLCAETTPSFASSRQNGIVGPMTMEPRLKVSSSCRHDPIQQSTRRSLFHVAVATLVVNTNLVGGGTTAWADEDVTPVESTSTSTMASDRKPYAPLENLLPATRVKVLIDTCDDTATSLTQDKNDKDTRQLIAKLKSLLLEPQEFFKTKQEEFTSRTYLDQKDTWPDWKKARQEETRNMFQIQVDPATELNEAFEQWGERRQFKRLRRQQLALEQSNKMRAALNAYTNNLIFGESYKVNASREEKKRLIRQYDQLPDVTSVIRSDLDLRDLYRNQVLTAMDDAKAELEYQLSNDESSMDFSELLSILRQAQSSCSEWFKFVPENDVKEALAVVRGEQNDKY